MSDNEYSDFEDDFIKCIKENYNLSDFLESNVTGPILYENAIKNYENKVESKVEDFYKKEIDFACHSGAKIFNNEKDYDHILDLFKIVFANINLNYNLDVILNNEDVMNDFASEEIKKKSENS